MSKVLVVGGSGFLGSHVADQLVHAGHEVTIFDKSESEWIQPDQKIIIGDHLDKTDVDKAVKGSDYIYHFAGIADIGESALDPYETIRTNIMGTTNLLRSASENDVKRFIFGSTIYVYSRFGSFYTASKQSCEIIVETFQKERGLDFTLLRYGSLYGPRAQEWNCINKFITQIVRDGKLDYFGTGEEKREYIHVEDAARMSVSILDSEYRNSAITVTGTQVYNSRELIDMIFEIAGAEPNVNFKRNDESSGHYVKTPYSYHPKNGRKIVPKNFVDLGEGILDIIRTIDKKDSDA